MAKFTGTIKELTDRGITFNGIKPDKVQLSMLTRLFGKKVGEVQKADGQKGKAATIWEFDDSLHVNISED